MKQSDIKPEEQDLVVRLMQDDERAFCDIYVKYKSRLIYFALKFVKSREFAEDICHDTLAYLWQNRHFLNPNLSFSAYLYTIARNRTLYMMRNIDKETQLKEAIVSQSIDYSTNTQDLVLTHELKLILEKALGKLTGRQREILSMSREKGLSHKEIADKLGLSVYTVQEHISTALKSVRTILNSHYGTFSYILFLFTLLLS